ncbi:MAG: zinc metallopeptidase [Clostridia bacterium]|nr:zinc metallopeptidase [Clostridia bacterium]
MFFGPFLFDYWYFILVVPALLFAGYCSANVNNTFSKYSKIRSYSNLTGAEVAQRILSNNGIFDVNIVKGRGKLTDHYDPRKRLLVLSEAVFDKTDVAALGVAAHEVGHAIQHNTGYSFLKLRNSIVGVTNFASRISPILLILGLFTGYGILVDIGIILFGGAVIFQLITLPVEYDASRRALSNLESCGILQNDEISSSKKVLNAAALTYVAGLLVAVASFLRVLLIFGGRRND